MASAAALPDARRLFGVSIAYLFLLFAALSADIALRGALGQAGRNDDAMSRRGPRRAAPPSPASGPCRNLIT